MNKEKQSFYFSLKTAITLLFIAISRPFLTAESLFKGSDDFIITGSCDFAWVI